MSIRAMVLLAIATILGATLRIYAALDVFWLDEIWSALILVNMIKSPWDVLILHHDNNHYLTTLWMWLVLPGASPLLYRLPSLLFGIGTIPLAALVARRWGNAAMYAAAMLTSLSFMLVTYSSEARGYAPAGFCALASFLALDRYRRVPSFLVGALFVAATVVGTLSHLTFITTYLAALTWSCVFTMRGPVVSRRALLGLAALHAAPLGLLAGLYIADLRQMGIGGGDDYSLSGVAASACALSLGVFDLCQKAVAFGAATAVLLMALGVFELRRQTRDEWVFFVVALITTPVLLLAREPEALYERYFFLAIVWTLVLYSYLFGRAWQQGGQVRALASVMLAAVVLANCAPLAAFLRIGRGNYREALVYMASNTAGSEVQISSDSRFRTALYTAFFVPSVPQGHNFVVVDRPAEWYVVLSQTREAPPSTLADDRYRLERNYPHAGLSGFTVAVYRSKPKKEP